MEREIAAAIASSNDVLAELLIGAAQGNAPTKGWVFQAVRTLANHSMNLGFQPQLTTEDILDWEREQ